MVFKTHLLTFEKRSNWTRVLPVSFCKGRSDFNHKDFLEALCLWFFTKICRPFRFRLKFDKSTMLYVKIYLHA